MVAAAGLYTTRADLAKANFEAPFVRESWTLGASGEPIRWRDTRADLRRRAALWREALHAGGLSLGDRVMLSLPSRWAPGGDCLLALLELDVLVTVVDDPVGAPDFQPTVLVATPMDALRLARSAPPSSLKRVFVTGEPGGSIASTRRAIEDELDAQCADVYALTEFGVVGWSCAAAPGGVHLNEAAFEVDSAASLVERAADASPEDDAGTRSGGGAREGASASGSHARERSVTGADGSARDALLPAELVLSTRGPRDVTLHRYRTGDLVRLRRGECACGSSWVRAEGGILGRVTERLAPRGVSLVLSQIEDVVRRHPAVREFAIVAYTRGELAIQLEPPAAIASESDRARVAAEVSEDLKRSLGVRLQCDVVPPGTLGAQDAGRRARRLRRQPS